MTSKGYSRICVVSDRESVEVIAPGMVFTSIVVVASEVVVIAAVMIIIFVVVAASVGFAETVGLAS